MMRTHPLRCSIQTNPTVLAALRRVSVCIAISCAAAATGCGRLAGPDCRDETRSMALSARLTSATAATALGDTDTAHVARHEARDARTKSTTAQEILWFVGSTLDRASVSPV